MKRCKGFLVLILILGIGIGSNTVNYAQDANPTATATSVVAPVSRTDVAILVVDVFEDPAEVETISKSLLSESNATDPKPQCAISLDGQDGAAIRGTSVTSNLRPYALPHGRLVFKHFENILNGLYGMGHPTPAINTTEEYWNTSPGTIWIKAVDTKKYNIKAIADNVRIAVNAFAKQGIKRFVINMSFAVVPCDQIPEVTLDDYKNQLSAWGINCPDVNAQRGTFVGFDELACSLDNSDNTKFAQDLIDTRDSGIAENAVAYAILQLAVMRPKVSQALQSSFPEPPSQPASPFTAFIDVLPPDVSVIQVASAGNDGEPYPYFPALSANVLSVAADYSTSPCPLTPSSQNNIENFLKNSGVTNDVDKIAESIAIPKSNAGELKANGFTSLTPRDYFNPPPANNADVLGCLFGTSFSAPEVSVQIAIDQQARNTVKCTTRNGIELNPLLAYQKWDSLDIPSKAAPLYCPDFPQ